jgi:hypothetical protein
MFGGRGDVAGFDNGDQHARLRAQQARGGDWAAPLPPSP